MRVVRIVFCPAEFHLSTNPVQFNELTPPPRLHIVGFMKCPDGVGCFGDYLSTGRNTCRDPRKHVVGPADYQAPDETIHHSMPGPDNDLPQGAAALVSRIHRGRQFQTRASLVGPDQIGDRDQMDGSTPQNAERQPKGFGIDSHNSSCGNGVITESGV